MEAGGKVKSLSHSNLPFFTDSVLMLSRFKLNYKGEISHWKQARCVFGRMRGGDEGTHPSSPISEVSSQNCLICQICILSQTVTPNMPILYFLYVTFGNTCLRIHPHLLVGCLFGYLAQV